jgi:hypothetical protein
MIHEPTSSLKTTNLLNRTLGGVYAILEITLKRKIPIFLLSLRTTTGCVQFPLWAGGLLPASAAAKFKPSPQSYMQNTA